MSEERLIDANALSQSILRYYEHIKAIRNPRARKRNMAEDAIILDVMGAIHDAPTVKPKQGEWIKVDEQPYFRKHFDKRCCSVCHTGGNANWNYCPACGAKMKGASDE